MRGSKVALLALLIAVPAFGRARISGYCEQGGQVVVGPGASTSTTKVQQSYPQCSITAYLTGTVTPATIYSDDNGTSLANPFAASKTGYWGFYVDNGVIDVRMSGGGIPVPFTWGAISVLDPATVPYVLNVLGFGAKGDGTTNDTAAIRSAIAAACTAAGSTVVFPAPYTFIIAPTVAANPILPTCSNLTIIGSGTIKIKDSAGSFHAIFGPPSGCVSNVTVDGMNFNMNSTNNPVTTLTGFFDSVPRMAITTQSEVHAAACGSNLTVRNNHFSDVRSAWLIFTAAANSRILNNLIDGVGGGSLDSDSSLIYGDPGSSGTIVSDNQIIASAAAAPMARTAIEFHDSALIHDNLSHKMEVGIIPDGAAPHVVTMKVHDNKITDTYYCMQVWSETSIYTTGRTGTVGLSDTDISHNTCSITLSKYPLLFGEGAGIVLSRFSTADFANISITDNLVTYELSTSSSEPATFFSTGIGFYDDRSTAPSPLRCDKCDFSRNTVVNAPATAFKFWADGSNISFNDEIAINPGSGLTASLPDFSRAGLLVETVSGPIGGTLSIKGGTYIDNLATSRMKYGIELATANTTGIIIDGATVKCTDATCASLIGAIEPNTNTQMPYVRATLSVPFSVLFPVQPDAVQSTIYDLRNNTLYSWQGTGGIWSSGPVLHAGTPTASSCGTSPTVVGTDRGGIVTVGSGVTTSCTLTFAKPFNSQPYGSLTILTNTDPANSPVLKTVTPIAATLVFTGVNLQENSFEWSFPLAN